MCYKSRTCASTWIQIKMIRVQLLKRCIKRLYTVRKLGKNYLIKQSLPKMPQLYQVRYEWITMQIPVASSHMTLIQYTRVTKSSPIHKNVNSKGHVTMVLSGRLIRWPIKVTANRNQSVETCTDKYKNKSIYSDNLLSIQTGNHMQLIYRL